MEVTELAGKAKELNKVSDDIKSTILSLQNELRKLNLGVEAWVPIGPDLENEPRHIGYARIHGLWHIGVRVGSLEPTNLLEANRQLRIDSIKFLGDLVRAIDSEASKVLAASNKAMKGDAA